jgi:hypothetical protein
MEATGAAPRSRAACATYSIILDSASQLHSQGKGVDLKLLPRSNHPVPLHTMQPTRRAAWQDP